MVVVSALVNSSSRPNSASPSRGQRSSCLSGGSATSKRPPTRRRGAAHSAVAAGSPKPLAVTNAAVSRHSLRPVSSARSQRTPVLDEMPSSLAASRSQAARRVLLSTRSHLVSGHCRASTSPGSPPPLPRSTANPSGGSPTASANARLRAIWSVTGPGPGTRAGGRR